MRMRFGQIEEDSALLSDLARAGAAKLSFAQSSPALIAAPRAEGPTDSVPDNRSTTYSVSIGGAQTGIVNTSGDKDWYRIDLQAEQSYVFELRADGASPLPDAYLELRDSGGNRIAIDDDSGAGHDSLLRFTPIESGVYYLNARAFETETGGYRISAALGAAQDPLKTIDYGFEVPTSAINVYFASGGQTFADETTSRNWSDPEILGAMRAFALFSAITPLTFTRVESAASADFIMMLVDLPDLLGQFLTIDGKGYGMFTPGAPGWSPVGMQPGGNGLATLIHEIGHGLGLAHPHDEGGGSEIMQGVTSEFGSRGTFEMNQGVYTMMSYNDGLYRQNGIQATPGPLDIALLQQKYGAPASSNANNTVYEFASYFRTIWDTAGTDVIYYNGSASAHIDLRAATLKTEFGGGGFASYLSTGGGFTIAAGVVIERAASGSGTDTIIGNDAANRIDGGAGSDTLDGGAGADTMIGGAGADTFIVRDATDVVTGDSADLVISHVSSYVLPSPILNVELGAGGLNVTGNALENYIKGNNLNNTIDGGAGEDYVEAGDGDDLIRMEDERDGVAGDGGYDIVETTATTTRRVNAEELHLLTGALNVDLRYSGLIFGNAAANSIEVTEALAIYGGEGADSISGGYTEGTLDGGDGDDTLMARFNGERSMASVVDGGGGVDAFTIDISGATTLDLRQLTFNGSAYAGSVLGGAISGIESLGFRFAASSGTKITLLGADFADAIAAAGGDDTLSGFGGADVLRGMVGQDTVYGGVGADRLMGDAGNDALYGEEDNDSINGGDGNDVLHGGVGNDTIVGGAGVNEASYLGASAVTVSLLLQGAVQNTGQGLDRLSQIQNLAGGDGADALIGDANANRLNGNGGADTMTGAAGNDTYVINHIGDRATENANAGVDTVETTISLILGENIENLTLLGAGAINGTGNALSNNIRGNSGANVLRGEAGADTVNGGAGADTLSGGKGDDLYYLDNAGDAVSEAGSGGTDTVIASVSWTMASNIENLRLVSNASTIRIDGIGNGLNNTITGTNQTNFLDGGKGADTLIGGIGADTYFVDNVGDVVVEESTFGRDTVMASVNYALTAFVEDLTLTGVANLTATGNGQANILRGNTGHNTLDGGAGADTLSGGKGNDTYIIDNVGDLVSEAGNAGVDTARASVSITLASNVENLVLTGAASINGIGNGLANVITGNSGANIIRAGGGADTISGGVGADSFVLDQRTSIDTIADFSVADDTLLIDNAAFTAVGANGALVAAAFHVGGSAADSADRLIYNSATGALLYDSDGNASGAAIQIATLTPGLALTAADFLVI